ncbi:hypothetical protein [Elizabethkingia anophelis]|uniref:hypothetical protein n=1 Tax=Elizabethkingia anophelis TaxID=1117645 RepID=UPI003892B173
MKVLYSKYLDGKPTFFKERIAKGCYPDLNVNYNPFHSFRPKIHTIRRNEEYRLCIGEKLEMFYDDGCEKIADIDCTDVQDVFMTWINGQFEVSVDDKYMYYTEITELALNDGFESYQDFRNYFIKKMDSNGCYSGYIIHWTNFKY